MSRPQYSMIEKVGPPLVAGILLCLWIATRFFPADQISEPKEHPPPQHGGRLIAIAGNRYHLELVVEQGELLRLYTLGADPSQVVEVDQQDLKAYVKADTQSASNAVTFKPTPQPGDRRGRTSCFTTMLPPGIRSSRLYATIPNLRINGNRYHASFAPDDQEIEMPLGVDQAEARDLYLVPRGKYTSADIQQNGGVTASQKYQDFQPRHDPHPKPGDPLCPVTQTKANPACTWTINGKVYEFCCPPCIDEYVRLAKEQPHQLRDPEEFFQRRKAPSP